MSSYFSWGKKPTDDRPVHSINIRLYYCGISVEWTPIKVRAHPGADYDTYFDSVKTAVENAILLINGKDRLNVYRISDPYGNEWPGKRVEFLPGHVPATDTTTTRIIDRKMHPVFEVWAFPVNALKVAEAEIEWAKLGQNVTWAFYPSHSPEKSDRKAAYQKRKADLKAASTSSASAAGTNTTGTAAGAAYVARRSPATGGRKRSSRRSRSRASASRSHRKASQRTNRRASGKGTQTQQ